LIIIIIIITIVVGETLRPLLLVKNVVIRVDLMRSPVLITVLSA